MGCPVILANIATVDCAVELATARLATLRGRALRGAGRLIATVPPETRFIPTSIMNTSESGISLSIGEVSRLLGVSPGILRTWEREALVFPGRTRGGHRTYGERHLRRLRKVARLYCDEKLNPAAIRPGARRSRTPGED